MWFEIHCHSTYSDGKNTPKEMAASARKKGLDGLVLTDHDEIKGSLKAREYAADDLVVYSGMEVSSSDGHILALDVDEIVPRDLSAQETVERIHELGGIAVAAHPYDRWRKGVGDLVLEVGFDAVEVVNGHTFGNTRDPFEAAGKAGKPMVGGTDAHSASEVGGVTIQVHGELIDSIRAGRLEIDPGNKYKLFMNHGVGIVKRRFKKHVSSKLKGL